MATPDHSAERRHTTPGTAGDWDPMGPTYQRFAEQYVAKLARAEDHARQHKQDVGLAYGLMLAMKLCTPKPQWAAWTLDHKSLLETLGLTWSDIQAFMAHGQVSPDSTPEGL